MSSCVFAQRNRSPAEAAQARSDQALVWQPCTPLRLPQEAQRGRKASMRDPQSDRLIGLLAQTRDLSNLASARRRGQGAGRQTGDRELHRGEVKGKAARLEPGRSDAQRKRLR